MASGFIIESGRLMLPHFPVEFASVESEPSERLALGVVAGTTTVALAVAGTAAGGAVVVGTVATAVVVGW